MSRGLGDVYKRQIQYDRTIIVRVYVSIQSNCPSKTVSSGMWGKITIFRINGILGQKLVEKTVFSRNIRPNFRFFTKIPKIRQSHYQPEWCANFQGNPNLASKNVKMTLSGDQKWICAISNNRKSKRGRELKFCG